MAGISNDKVSIVLPTYNGQAYLRQAIDSCLAQTYQNIELIIVNDASTDGTEKIIKSYGDPRIIYVKNEQNKLLPGALNVGFGRSSGQYLTWISDDNILDRVMVETMVKFMQKRNSQFAYADFYLFHAADLDHKKQINLPAPPEFAKIRNDIGPCFMYTSAVKETIGNYDVEAFLSEDFDYWVRVSQKFHIDHLAKPLYFFRDHPNSLTVSRSLEVKSAGALVAIKNGLVDINFATAWIINLLSTTGYPTKYPAVNGRLLNRGAKLMQEVMDRFKAKDLTLTEARAQLKTILTGAGQKKLNWNSK